jgi:RluA family pseudouridine synthase
MSEEKPIREIPTLVSQDDDVIVINKPANLLSIEDGYDPSLAHLRSVLEPLYGHLWMAHRLDKGTSGVMVLARNASAHRNLNESFRLHKISKIYHGLITPVPDWQQRVIDFPLRPNADRKHRTRVDHTQGKQAITTCSVIKWFPLGVLMEIKILTGITHQIRAHLRSINLSIFGDDLYAAGLPPQPLQMPRLMLHARSLTFPHPTTGEMLTFHTPYPDDFRDAYNQLKVTTSPDALIL